MRTAQGNPLGRPNSSWLKQFPHRPMAWANGNAGATESKRRRTSAPRRRATQAPTAPPAATPPQMPSPPSQILKASRGWCVYSS